MTTTFPILRSGGFELDADHLDHLRESTEITGDGDALRARMAEDGYILLRGALDRELVLESRRQIVQRLADAGALEPGTDPMHAVAAGGLKMAFKPDLAKGNQPLHALLYSGPMIEIFQRMLGGPVLHFDFTWMRAVAPGKGTPSHCDIVYMGRGTRNLYTAWTPLGDIDFVQGGLMVLEGSHHNERLKQTYGSTDVDTFCTNRPEDRPSRRGHLSHNPNQIRRSLGGRWLTTEYRAGDVLIFSMFTVHASLDNHSRSIRLSSDTRYQLASEPADERWIGPNPIGHSKAGRRGRIC